MIPSGLCTYVLRRTGIGDYILNPVTRESTFTLDDAHVWLWPAATPEELLARIAALGWRGAVYAIRARP